MRKWNIVTILLVLGLLAGALGCAAPAPAPTPTAKPAPAPTTAAPKPTTAAPAPTTAAPKPTTAAPAPTTAAPAPKPKPAPAEIKISSSSTGTQTHINIVIMSELLNKYSSWLKATPIATPGWIDSLRFVQQGRSDVSASGVIEATNMINGTEYFKDQKLDLRWLWPYLYTPVSIASKKGSKFTTLESLKDVTMGVVPPGSAGAFGADALWQALGFRPKKELPYAYAEMASAMKSGTIDAMYFSVGLGSPQMVEAATINDLQWIPLDDATWKKLDALKMGYQRLPIPANTYRLQDKEIWTQGWTGYHLVKATMSDEMAYEITRIFWDNLEEAKKLNAGVIKATKETFDSLIQQPGPAPIHPGALKYFKEKGILK